jgi:ubiquinol-cytochrome c reductase cytochrome c1 subunit
MVWMFPKGKHFNPYNNNVYSYFDHMIIGMPRQLYDGLVEFEDGTPASTPQMANDVCKLSSAFMQRRAGHSYPDKQIRKWMILRRLLCS